MYKGLSPTGGLCLIKKNRFPGVMIAEDVGMYHGVLTAAHELTHLYVKKIFSCNFVILYLFKSLIIFFVKDLT